MLGISCRFSFYFPFVFVPLSRRRWSGTYLNARLSSFGLLVVSRVRNVTRELRANELIGSQTPSRLERAHENHLSSVSLGR